MIISARQLVDRAWETREGELLHWPEPAREAIGHLAAQRSDTLLRTRCYVHVRRCFGPNLLHAKDASGNGGRLLAVVLGETMAGAPEIAP
jgi:hypothetical protein